MQDRPTFVNARSDAAIALKPAWRRHVTRQRLRVFVILSVLVHVVLGMSWGVPAYVRQRRMEAEQRRQEAMLEQQRRAAEASLAKAKADDLTKTIEDVQERTHKAFENLTTELPQPEKDKTWTAIEPALHPVERQLAEALGDRSMTEQDLRNLQAGVDRTLVETVNDTLGVDAGREEVEAFLAAVASRVVPELVAHYKDQLVSKVAQPVRNAADMFVKGTGTDASTALNGMDAARHSIGDALGHLRDETDAVGGEIDQARSLTTRKPPAAGDEISRHIASAKTHLAAATTAAETIRAELTKLVERAKPLAGGSELNARLTAATDSLSAIHETFKAVNDALAANDYAGTGRHITALALAERKLGTHWGSASEAEYRSQWSAEQSARGALALVQDKPIPLHVDRQFSTAFQDKAAKRLTDTLIAALRTRLTAAGIKNGDALVASAQDRLKDMLQEKVADIGGYGISTSQYLRDFTGSAGRDGGADGERLSGKFMKVAEPVIDAGVIEVVTDASLDSRLAEMVSKPENNKALNDVRDRVAMLAARASDGRASALDSVSLTDLRASAMARSSDTDRAAAPDTAPTTEEAAAEGPPVIEDIKKEILASLHAELQKVLDGKLAAEKAAKLWDHVAAASDADVNHLSRDLIDPAVSDSELESRRLAFSGKFLKSVGEGLNKTASDDVAAELLKQLQGKAGDALAKIYKDAVRDNVGHALAHEWREAADAEGAKAGQGAREMRDALDSAQSVADKASQVLDQVKGDAARTASDNKADPAAVHQTLEAGRGKLQEVTSALAGSKADVDKAKQDAPAEAAQIKGHLEEIGKSFDAVASGLSDADKTGKAGDAEVFAKSVEDTRKEVEQIREKVSRGRADLDREEAEARARFIKAAQEASNDSDDKTPGVKSRVQSKFDGAFRKDALPELADEIVKDYEQKLEKAGVAADAKDAEALHRDVAAALDKKVTGTAQAGEAALADLEGQKFFDDAKNAKGAPTTQQTEHANAIADKVTDAGVAAAVHGDAAGGTAHNAVNDIAGPDSGVIDLKDKVARMEGQIRGGRGGVLADANDGAEPKGDAAGLASMRRKWQGILAGLDGAGDGPGGKHKNGGASPAGAGVASGSGAAGNGTAAGAAGGTARGGSVPVWAKGYGPGDGYGVDKKLHDELAAVVKDRATQQGENWERSGANGANGLSREREENRPATILAPATQPTQSAKNDKPYTPTFRSLRFAVVPYLNKPITIGDNFDAWNDIPVFHLRPQLTPPGSSPAGLTILDDLPVKVAWDNHGLYFMYDMIIPEAQPAPKIRTDEFWNCDCLEIFVDTMNTKELQRGTGAGQQFWFWPFGSRDDANAPGGESFFSRQRGFNFVELKTGDLYRFARQTPRGYQMQCRIPIERVRDADLTPGKIVGLNVTVETGGKMHYYWSASKLAGTSYHPDTWGDVLLGGSDGRVEFPDKLATEAGPGASNKNLKAFVLGEPLRIRVTDHDMNLNEKVKDKVSVTVRNPRGEQEIAILEETGRDTGVFEGSVRTALSLGEKVPGVVSAYEGESLTVMYIDQARANGARNVEIVSKITAGPSVMVDK